jgi:hypothetical protein
MSRSEAFGLEREWLAAGVPVFPCPGFPFMEMLCDE